MVDKKKPKFAKRTVSLILILLGLFYAFLPHNVHVAYGLDWIIGLNFPHIAHIVLGLISLVVGILLLRTKKK